MRIESILHAPPTTLTPDEAQTIKASLKQLVTDMRNHLANQTLSTEELALLSKDIKALITFILAPQEYTIDEIQQFPQNNLLGKVATLALKAVTYFSLRIYRATSQGTASGAEDNDQQMQELIIASKKLIGEAIVNPYYERSTDKSKSFYPCGQLKITLPLEFHLMAITLFKLLCPMLKSPDKKAIIFGKLITLVHVADYYVKQVKVKAVQPRIAMIGGPSNSLSVIFNCGPLLESDTIFNRDGSDSAKRVPINDSHLENARNIYYEYEHAIRLQHTKQDEGKGLLVLSKKLHSISPSFDSLCSLIRISNYNIPICIEAVSQFATSCFIGHCNAMAEKFYMQTIEKIQQQSVDTRGALRLRMDRFDPKNFLSHELSTISVSSILAWDTFHVSASPEFAFGYQPFLYSMEEYAINRPNSFPTFLEALVNLALTQPHTAFAIATAVRKASICVKKTLLSIIDTMLAQMRVSDSSLHYSFPLFIIGLMYVNLLHANLPIGVADATMVRRTVKLSMAHAVLRNIEFIYPAILCLDSYSDAAATLSSMIQEDVQALCQRHKLEARSASFNVIELTMDEQCTVLSVLLLFGCPLPSFEKLLLAIPLFLFQPQFAQGTESLMAYNGYALNVLLGLSSLYQPVTDDDMLQRITDHTAMFDIKLTASQCIGEHKRMTTFQKQYMNSMLQTFEAILREATETAGTQHGGSDKSNVSRLYTNMIEFLGSFQLQGAVFEARAPFIDYLTLYLALKFPAFVEILELLCRQSSIVTILLWPRISTQMRDTFCKSGTMLRLFLKAVSGFPDYITSMKRAREDEISRMSEKIFTLAEVERTGRTPEYGPYSVLNTEQCREKLSKLRQKKAQLEKAFEQSFSVMRSMRMELFTEHNCREFYAAYGIDQSLKVLSDYTLPTIVSVETALASLLKYPKYRSVPRYMETVTALVTDRDLLELVRVKAAIASINTSDPDGDALKKALEKTMG